MSEFGVLGGRNGKIWGSITGDSMDKKHVRMQCCCYSYSCNTRLQSTTCPVSSSSFLSSDYINTMMTLPWQQSLLPTAWAEMDANKTPNWQRWLPNWHQRKIHQYFIGQAVESFPAGEQPCRLLQLKILPEQVSRGPEAQAAPSQAPGHGRPAVACYSHNIRLRDSVVHHVFRQFTDWVTGSRDHRPLPEMTVLIAIAWRQQWPGQAEDKQPELKPSAMASTLPKMLISGGH